MANDYDFKKLRRMMKVYWVVQASFNRASGFHGDQLSGAVSSDGNAPGVHERYLGQLCNSAADILSDLPLCPWRSGQRDRFLQHGTHGGTTESGTPEKTVRRRTEDRVSSSSFLSSVQGSRQTFHPEHHSLQLDSPSSATSSVTILPPNGLWPRRARNRHAVQHARFVPREDRKRAAAT